jgi:peroxiredoxin
LLSEEQRATTEILALAPDGLEELQLMVDRVAEDDGRIIGFPLLSDPDAAVINRYGLFNAEDPRGRAIPHPTTYVIDRDGMVRWKMTEVDYSIRPENEDILRELNALR